MAVSYPSTPRYRGGTGQPTDTVIHASVMPPPPSRTAPGIIREPARLPVRVGFIVNTFSFGGSETETIELVHGCDPALIQFTGIAVARPQPLPEGEPPRDGSFPPIVMPAGPQVDCADPRVRCAGTLDDAVRLVLSWSDIVLTWGIPNLQDLVPSGRLPKFVIVSKDSGDWASSFLHPNSLLTASLVANSTSSAGAFPEAVRHRVKVIHDGINPVRVIPRKTRAQQRQEWGVEAASKVVGYLGRIEYDKGVNRIADAMHYLPPDWTAVLVGVSPTSGYAAEFEEYCRRTIPGRYRLLGWSHDIGGTLSGFDVFCHPSEHEGFSNSIAEAWLAGVPTVYTAGTGAIPDVGDLGIPVPPDADGAKIAAALRRAISDPGLASHAKAVIESQFLISNNIERWTSYLHGLHAQPAKPRVLLVFPPGLASHAPAWLRVCAETGIGLAGCCIPADRVPTPQGFLEYAADGCPLFHVAAASHVARAVRYTRPDCILTFQGRSSDELIPSGLGLAVIMTPIDPRAGTANWARWLRYLTLTQAQHVFQ